MADLADITDERYAPIIEADVAHIRQLAEEMEEGQPGECVKCGEDMPRLVNGVCCPCRDLIEKRKGLQCQ